MSGTESSGSMISVCRFADGVDNLKCFLLRLYKRFPLSTRYDLGLSCFVITDPGVQVLVCEFGFGLIRTLSPSVRGDNSFAHRRLS